MSSSAKLLALAGFLLATVTALSDKPSASSLAATASATHDAKGKTKATIGIHDAHGNGQGSRNTIADPPTGTSHEPTAHVQLHLEHAGCSSDEVELNLGLRSSPEVCAAAVLGHAACDRSFIFAPSHPEWGCRCCGRENGGESSHRQESFDGSPAWNLYVAGIAEAEAEAVEGHQRENVQTPVVWVSPSACGCNACPCVIVAEPPAASATEPLRVASRDRQLGFDFPHPNGFVASELTAWVATQSVNAAVWQAEIDSLATTVSRATVEASQSSAEARAAELAARRAQADATAAVMAAEATAPAAQGSGGGGMGKGRGKGGKGRSDGAPAAVDTAPLEDFGRQVGVEIGAAAQAYPGDGYAPTLAAGDGVAQSVGDFAAAAALS